MNTNAGNAVAYLKKDRDFTMIQSLNVQNVKEMPDELFTQFRLFSKEVGFIVPTIVIAVVIML